jgi:8-oxo-dGTP pyrophosphatase MutT (NUDIX family)
MLWSVSLIPYHKHMGLLVGEEYRWKEGLRFHFVGGKIEKFDEDPVAAAAREFIEETNLLSYEYLQKVHMEKFMKWTQENPITLETKYPHYTFFTQKLLEDEIRKTNLFFDYKVSENGKIHRFYFLNIHTIKDKELQNILLKMSFEYSLYDPALRTNGQMWSLCWTWPQSFYLLPNRSALFVKFTQTFFQLHFQHKLFPSSHPSTSASSILFKNKPKKEKKDVEEGEKIVNEIIDNIIHTIEVE